MSHWYLLDDDCEWESFFSDPQNPGRASQMKPELNNNNSETMQQCTVEYIQYIFNLVSMTFIFKVTKKMIPIPNHRPTNTNWTLLTTKNEAVVFSMRTALVIRII